MLGRKDIPIRTRLLLHAVLTTGIALVLAGAAAIYMGDRAARRHLERDLTIRADTLAGGQQVALMFGELYKEQAATDLAYLAADPNVAYAVTYDAEGNPFAAYHRDAESGSGPLRAPAAESRFGSGYLSVARRIEGDDETPFPSASTATTKYFDESTGPSGLTNCAKSFDVPENQLGKRMAFDLSLLSSP